MEDLDWPILALTVVGRVAKVQTYGGKGKERAVSVPGDTENFIDNELNKIRQEANAEHSLAYWDRWDPSKWMERYSDEECLQILLRSTLGAFGTHIIPFAKKDFSKAFRLGLIFFIG